MADRAKLFKSGGSQAVQLPKEYRFHGSEEVLIYRQGRRVILEPLKQDFPYPDPPPAAEPGRIPPRHQRLHRAPDEPFPDVTERLAGVTANLCLSSIVVAGLVPRRTTCPRMLCASREC